MRQGSPQNNSCCKNEAETKLAKSFKMMERETLLSSLTSVEALVSAGWLVMQMVDAAP